MRRERGRDKRAEEQPWDTDRTGTWHTKGVMPGKCGGVEAGAGGSPCAKGVPEVGSSSHFDRRMR